MADDKMSSLQDVAKRLDVSERTIHRYLNSGKLSGKFYIDRWKFSEQDIQAFMNRRSRNDSKGIAQKRKYTKKDKTTHE